MERLTSKDAAALCAFVHEVYAARDLTSFTQHVLTTLPTLVSSDATVYNEYNFRRNRIVWHQNPNIAFAGSERIWERYSSEHPILQHIRRTRDGRAVKFSDFTSMARLRRTHLYNEFFRPLHLRHQMCALFGEPKTLLAGLALNRERKDFSERDRLVLNLLRPHLQQAQRNAETLSDLQEEIASLQRTLESLDGGIVLLTRKRRIRSMTPAAEKWLGEYFGRTALKRERLPEQLERWVAEHEQRRSPGGTREPLSDFSVHRDGRELRAQLLGAAGCDTLVLRERRRGPSSRSIDLPSLRRLGLTSREAQILAWVTLGKTNAEVAAIVGAKPLTVKKHLEHVYAKLGVTSRTAAATLVLRRLSQG